MLRNDGVAAVENTKLVNITSHVIWQDVLRVFVLNPSQLLTHQTFSSVSVNVTEL